MGTKLKLKDEQFGKLKVIKCVGRDINSNYLWECLCECGNRVIRKAAHLKIYKKSKPACSTGCSQTLAPGEAGLNILIGRYKTGAIKRGLIYKLTKKQAKKLFLDNCKYCGKKPNKKIRKYFSIKTDFVYNGIDRINNDEGYIIYNCFTCCALCNKMKGTLSLNTFFRHICKIYTNTSKKL